MSNTQKNIKEVRSSIDVFLELVDARAPFSCRNPMLDELIGDKPRVVVFTKIDVADPSITTGWKAKFDGEQNTRVVLVSSKNRHNLPAIPATCIELVRELKANPPAVIRGMIVGIPNVGKSTLINALSHGHKAAVAPKPGHTRGLQKIRLNEHFELVDTPGLLWHKFEDERVGHRLAMIGAIKDDVYDFPTLVYMTIDYLMQNYPDALQTRYKLIGTSADPGAIMEEIARKRGFIVRGGGVDLDRAYTVFMNDLRSGALGRISFERAE